MTIGQGDAGPQVPGRRELADVEATRTLGRELASLLGPGDVVVLDGPLGAGKTALTGGLAAGLGVRGRVTSPTFVLARRHPPATPGGVGLVHVDAYRLRGADPDAPVDPHALADELEALDLDAELPTDVVVVEWGAGMVESLSTRALWVRMDRGAEPDVRTARWEWLAPDAR